MKGYLGSCWGSHTEGARTESSCLRSQGLCPCTALSGYRSPKALRQSEHRLKRENSNERPSSQDSRAEGTRRVICCCRGLPLEAPSHPHLHLLSDLTPFLPKPRRAIALGSHKGLGGSKSQPSLAVPSLPNRCPTRNPPARSTFLPASFRTPDPLLAVPEASFPRTAARPQGPRFPVPVATPAPPPPRPHFPAGLALLSRIPAGRRPPSPGHPIPFHAIRPAAPPRPSLLRLRGACRGAAAVPSLLPERPPRHPARSAPVVAGLCRWAAPGPGSRVGRGPSARRVRLIHRGLPLPSPSSRDAPAARRRPPSLGLRKGSIGHRRTGSLGPVLA